VNIGFITRGESNSNDFDRLVSWACLGLIALEIGMQALVSAALGLNGMVVGVALAGCVYATTTALLVLRLTVKPQFGNRDAILADKALTGVNGAALDVHVVVDH
jgi:hypothetical protein